MGRNAQKRRERREQAADDRYMSGQPSTTTLDYTLKCVICGQGESNTAIPYNRRRYCAEHLSVYLLSRSLRNRGMSKRDAAKEVLRVVAGQKAAHEAT
jgi:hypothetical protein